MKNFKHIGIITAVVTCMVGVAPAAFAKEATPFTMESRMIAQVQKPTANLNKAKNELNKMLDRLNDYYNKTQIKIKNLKKMGDEDVQKQKLLDAIDGYIATIKNYKTRLQAATDRNTLKQISQEVRALIDTSKAEIQKQLSGRLEKHIENFEQKKEHFLQLVEARIEKFKNEGKDTAKLNQTFEKCRTAMNNGEPLLQATKAILGLAQNWNKNDKPMAQLLQDAMKKLKEARATLSKTQELCHLP